MSFKMDLASVESIDQGVKDEFIYEVSSLMEDYFMGDFGADMLVEQLEQLLSVVKGEVNSQ